MELARKADDLTLVFNEDIRALSWWRPMNHHFVEIPTVTGVAYPDSRGVVQQYIKVRLYFANHYQSTLANYERLWQAQRRRQTLTFTDRANVTYDVFPHERIDEAATSIWDEVVARDIVIVEVNLRRMEYTV